MNNAERLALDMATVSATATLVSAPCFVYSAVFSPTNTNTTGECSLADTSASADAIAESAKIQVRFGSQGASASVAPVVMNFNPPLYIAQTLAAGTTGVQVSVTYLLKS